MLDIFSLAIIQIEKERKFSQKRLNNLLIKYSMKIRKWIDTHPKEYEYIINTSEGIYPKLTNFYKELFKKI